MWYGVKEQSQYWFRYWLVTCSVPSHWPQSIMSRGSLETNLNGISMNVIKCPFQEMYMKMLSANCQPLCWSLSVLMKYESSIVHNNSEGNQGIILSMKNRDICVRTCCINRDHSGHGLSQWEEVLLFNAFSHWPCPYAEWSLHFQLSCSVVMAENLHFPCHWILPA